MRRISKLAKAAAGAACATLLAGAAVQADDSPFSYYLTLTGASEYMFRGISYTDEDPTINSYVEFDYDTKSIFGTAYIAFWTSNIDSGVYTPWEQDIYAGIRPVTGPISWEIAVWYYSYPGAEDASSLDYVEFKVGASATPVTNLSVGVTAYYTPDQLPSYAETGTIEGTIAYTLPTVGIFTPTVGGLVGYTGQFESLASGVDFTGFGVEDYTYWNAGLKLAVDKFFMDFRYWDTTIDDGLADARFVFSAGFNLLP